ncbi:hypothetical protein ACOMHN_065387 [Nucella lapillus]
MLGQDGSVRLTRASHPWQGSLEVYHGGRWGTVCDDSWTQTNTEVVCRQMGFVGSGQPTWSGGHAKYGLTIWLDDIRCYGSESHLGDCRHEPWGTNDCDAENIEVTCRPTSCQKMKAYAGVTCANGAQCVGGTGNTFHCVCTNTTTGTYCEEDINECERDNGGCSHHCTNHNATGYSCSCPNPELQLSPDQHNCYSPHAGITCDSQGMSVTLTKAGLPGVRAEYLMVDGTNGAPGHCRARDAGAHIVLNLPLNGCGTTRRAEGDEWVYENHITSGPVTVAGVVSPVRKLNVTVRCRYPQHLHVHQTYNVHSEQLVFLQDTQGHFPIKLDLEQGGQVYHPGDLALVVDPGTPVTLHFSLGSTHPGLRVSAHNCHATPTSNATGVTYTLIRDGCVLDSTLQVNSTRSGQGLTLQAFKFVGTSNLVFLHCDVMICNASDPTSLCQQGCLQTQAPPVRRNVELSTFLEQQHVSLGPIRVLPSRPTEEEEEMLE